MKKYIQPEAQLVNLSMEHMIASSDLNINDSSTTADPLSQKFVAIWENVEDDEE